MILDQFVDETALHLNKTKSQIIFSSGDTRTQRNVCEILGISKGTLPFEYLRIPISSKKSTLSDYMPPFKKTSKYMATRKGKLLSYTRRNKLIKSMCYGNIMY